MVATSHTHREVDMMRKADASLKEPGAMGLYREVNRLRARDGKQEIGFLTFAGQISRFHEDRNPQVAEALRKFGMSVKCA